MKLAKTITDYSDPKYMTRQINAFIKYNQFELIDIKYESVEQSGIWGSSSHQQVVTAIYEDHEKKQIYDIDNYRISNGLCLKCNTEMKYMEDFEKHDCRFVGLQKQCRVCSKKFSVNDINAEDICHNCWTSLVFE